MACQHNYDNGSTVCKTKQVTKSHKDYTNCFTRVSDINRQLVLTSYMATRDYNFVNHH